MAQQRRQHHGQKATRLAPHKAIIGTGIHHTVTQGYWVALGHHNGVSQSSACLGPSINKVGPSPFVQSIVTSIINSHQWLITGINTGSSARQFTNNGSQYNTIGLNTMSPIRSGLTGLGSAVFWATTINQSSSIVNVSLATGLGQSITNNVNWVNNVRSSSLGVNA